MRILRYSYGDKRRDARISSFYSRFSSFSGFLHTRVSSRVCKPTYERFLAPTCWHGSKHGNFYFKSRKRPSSKMPA